MAYIDSQLELSDAQAITTTAISTNVIDLATLRKGGSAAAGDISANVQQDWGNGLHDNWAVVRVNTALTGGTSLAVTLETADNAALSVGQTVLATSGTVVAASLTKGTSLILIRLPSALYKRYLGFRYTVVGTFGAGSVDAYIASDPQSNRIYKSGFAVQ